MDAYRTLPGVEASKHDWGRITKMAKRYGADAVMNALKTAGDSIGMADDPLVYLGGVLKNPDRPRPVFRAVTPRRVSDIASPPTARVAYDPRFAGAAQ